MHNPAYAPLWVKSNFSFLEGAGHPHELVQAAHSLGLGAMALTDRDGVYGIVQAHMRAKELGVKLLIGAETSVGESFEARERLILLAENRRGYANLCQLISKGRLACQKGESLLTTQALCEAGDGLTAIALDPALLPALKDAYGERLYGAIIRGAAEADLPNEAAMRAASRAVGVQTVAVNEVLYPHRERKMLHDVLRAIDHGVPLSAAGTRLKANAEHALKSLDEMRALFHDDEASLWRSGEIAARCDFSLDELHYRYPNRRLPEGQSVAEYLRTLSSEGAHRRYPSGVPDALWVQMQHELSLIDELDYGGYFLTMYEIVQFCARENILCQGRGSAANSVVCFCLGITAVDPLKLDLLFERFISRERAEPPDIDLDIEHARREEVIQWVYETYGRRHAAMVANVIRYRTKSAVRDVGKALGLPLTALTRLSNLLGSRMIALGDEALRHAGLDPALPVHQHLLRLVEEIRDFPRHLSIHPGGFLLGSEPVDTLVPIENATMDGRTVIQWDKYSIEDLNLFKVDLLGLGALTHCHNAFDLLRRHKGVDMGLADIPPDDADTFKMISAGDTVGVFQIESRAQMAMLPRLKPQCYYDLVIEVAIVRPGPIQGDMVHPYLRRRSGEEAAHYPHPALKKVLAKTLGVPIFQEQVMKIAMLVGGYSGGEADQLRKDMGAWRSSGRIERHHEVLVRRMVENGIDKEYAERIFDQIRGFGEYGFPESHAASFALIAYATAWLRCNHPEVFSCALLNALPMGFYSAATIVDDAKRKGVTVLPVDIRRSAWECTLEKRGEGFAVRMGFRFIKGLLQRDAERLGDGPREFTDLENCVRRSGLREASLRRLAEAGALTSLGVGRRDALWEIGKLCRVRGDSLPMPKRGGMQALPFAPLATEEAVRWDYLAAAHSARGHPLSALRPWLSARGIPTAAELNALPDGARGEYVGLVICRQQPMTASGVTFYTLEDESGFVNLVVWQKVFARYAVIARTAPLLGVRGKVQSESGVIHLVAERLWEPEVEVIGAGSRDFC